LTQINIFWSPYDKVLQVAHPASWMLRPWRVCADTGAMRPEAMSLETYPALPEADA